MKTEQPKGPPLAPFFFFFFFFFKFLIDKIVIRYFFVEFQDAEEAERARKKIEGFRLDKNHVFSAFFLNDIFTYSEVPDEWQPPEKPEFREKVRDHFNSSSNSWRFSFLLIVSLFHQEHLRYWLLDPQCRDQFGVLIDDTTSIFWNNQNDPHELVRTKPVAFFISFFFSFFFLPVLLFSSCFLGAHKPQLEMDRIPNSVVSSWVLSGHLPY